MIDPSLPPLLVAEATRVIRYRQVDPIQLEAIKEDPAVLHRLDADSSKVHAVGQAGRPGLERFLTRLEHEHFSPIDPAREPLLETRAVEWMGLAWCLVSIPFAERRLFHEVAGRCGLRVADGVPMAIDGRACHGWPMRSTRCRNLENTGGVPMPGQPGYEEARAREAAECEAIREATRRRYRRDVLPTN